MGLLELAIVTSFFLFSGNSQVLSHQHVLVWNSAAFGGPSHVLVSLVLFSFSQHVVCISSNCLIG